MRTAKDVLGYLRICVNDGAGLCALSYIDELEAMLVKARPGTQHVPLPDGSGKLLSATVFSGRLLIACENGVYARTAEGAWERILPMDDPTARMHG